jgi:pyruvate dehydrogenase E2 component (dihydrolipoamide acetyltransferase)
MAALEFRFPDTGEGIDAGELVEWHVEVGQEVREDEPMADVQTDKAIVTIPCPTTGRVLELRFEVGDTVPVGEVMAVFESGDGAPAAAPEPTAASAEAAVSPAPGDRGAQVLASPAVRKRAAELGIELAAVGGSGPGGRIELADLDGAAGGARTLPLRGVRRAIARTMTEAWRTIPHVIDYREVDAGALLAWRDRLRDQAADEQQRRAVTVTPLLVRIAVSVLPRHPYVNGSIDLEREQITLHDEYNIGIAVAAPEGLVVPVVRHADRLGVLELAGEVARLTLAARENRLRSEEVAGGTFTVNNYGGLGIWLGTPIIKPGEAANLGFGAIREQPVVRDGRIVARPVAALAVSGDHRLLDGHTLGAFVSEVIELIEDPGPLE